MANVYLASYNERHKAVMVSDKFTKLLFSLERSQSSKLHSNITPSKYTHLTGRNKNTSIGMILKKTQQKSFTL